MFFLQFLYDDKVQVGEVQFFTRLAIQSTSRAQEEWTFANIDIVKLYLEPDPNLLHLSSQVLATSILLDNLSICEVKSIHSVVAMIPHILTLLNGVEAQLFCMMEKPGVDISDLGVPYSVYSEAGDDEDENGDGVDVEYIMHMFFDLKYMSYICSIERVVLQQQTTWIVA